MRFNPMVIHYIRALPAPLREGVVSSLDYLATFGRSAALPDVRHRIAKHLNLSETRSDRIVDGTTWAVRVLVVFHTDRLMLACVAGNKAGYISKRPPNDWYHDFVPVALAIYDHMKGDL